MKNSKVWLCIIIVLMLTTMGSFAEKKTTTSKTTPAAISVGEKKGKLMGKIDGELAATKDFQAKKNSSPQKALPKRSKIVKTYDLKRETAVFRAEFIASYRKEFIKCYKVRFADLLIDPHANSKERATINAKTLGEAEGIQAASYDVLNNNRSDWLKAYNAFVLEASLVNRYNLAMQLSSYQISFKAEFKAAYKASYRKYFENYTSRMALNSTNYHTVTFFDDTMVYDKLSMKIDAGGLQEVSNSTAKIYFEQGTVYQDTIVGLHRIANIDITKSPYYDTASGTYQIMIKDKHKKINLYKPVTLSFPYKGHPRIGIYKWVGTKWLYMPTETSDETIFTKIPKGEYRGGKYALFIDQYFKVPNDIVYNWAYKDILMSIRRGFIVQDNVFRPNDTMTRIELADLLYRSLNFRQLVNTYKGGISDSASIKGYEKQVNYVVGLGLMSLDDKKAFNPNGVVSYNDFIAIAKKIGGKNFDYNEVSKAMYYDALHVSALMNDPSSPMTKAEVVFAMNRVLD